MNAPPDTSEARVQTLGRCQSGRAMREFAAVLSSSGLLGLLRIAATQSGRWVRADLLNGGGTYRMHGEDLAWLEQHGHLEKSGKWVVVTDQGNALVRAVLAFAQTWEGGAES